LGATAAQIDAARNRGLAWLYSHQQGEGGWAAPEGAQAVTTHSAFEALNVAGTKGYPYFAALAHLQNLKTDSIDSISRKLHATAVAGGNGQVSSDYLLASVLDPALPQWGTYAKFLGTFADTALALRAIRVGQATGASNYPNLSTAVRDATFCNLLQRQNSDGGWSANSSLDFPDPNPAKSTLLPTVLMSIELNAGVGTTGESGSCNLSSNFFHDQSVRSISTATTNALNWLLTLKKTDNGFGEGANSTLLESAMVYEALRTLRPNDPSVGPTLDYLLSKQNPSAVGANSNGGSWNASALQTAYVLKVLPPPAAALVDTDGDGIPNAVELLLGTNGAVPDSRWLASGNNSGGVGLSIPVPLNANVFLSKASTLSFSAAGGKPPYSWRIAGGALPPGYTLNPVTGAIQGNAIATGNFNFVYAVNDSASGTAVHADGRLVVVRSTLPGDINGDGVVDAVDMQIKAGIVEVLSNFVSN
jgi:hypothetical protein